MTSSPDLLAGVCIACGCLIVQHRDSANRSRGCAYALRVNNEFLQANGQPPMQPARQFQILDGGRNGAREVVIRGRDVQIRAAGAR